MPKIVPYRAPSSVASSGAGLGALYAAAGTASGQMQQRLRSQEQSDKFLNFGMGLAGNAFRSYLGDKSYGNRLDMATKQKEALDEHNLQNRKQFLTDLYGANPDLQADPKWQMYHAAIENGTLKPAEAIKGYEASTAHAAAQAGKNTATANTAEYKDRMAGVAENRVGAYGENVASQIDTRAGTLDQKKVYQSGLLGLGQDKAAIAQQNADQSGQNVASQINNRTVMQGQGQQRLNQPKSGAIINDPEYRDANDKFVRSMKMADAIERQKETIERNNANLPKDQRTDTSLLDERLLSWHERAAEADRRSSDRLKILQSGGGVAPPQSAPSAVPSQDQRNEPVIPHDENTPEPQPSGASIDPNADLETNVRALKLQGLGRDEVRQILIQNGYQ